MTEAEVVKKVNDVLVRTMVGLVHHTNLDHTGLLEFYDVRGEVLARKLCEELKGIALEKQSWEITSNISIPTIERTTEPKILP